MDNREPGWLEYMLSSSFYPNRPRDVKLIQTHLSWVFLAGDRVYKVKKPVDFGFLDFTSLNKRRFFCNEEIRLNQRLCPDIYLGTASITREEGGSFCLNGRGETVEWAVEMKRMPDNGLMSVLIGNDEVGIRDIAGIVGILAPFYSRARAGKDKLYLGGLDVVGKNCEENFTQTEEFTDRVFPRSDFELIRGYSCPC